jgi:glycosyltransferase involved in cell wall biosynthesis
LNLFSEVVLQTPKNKPRVHVIIPAFNEQNAVSKVITEIPSAWVSEIIVVDNGSTDDTYQQAIDAGATALRQTTRGYGIACLTGIEYLKNQKYRPDIVVFLDGDYSDYPEEIPALVEPIQNGEVDFVIGSRTLGKREIGSMTPQQLFGNWLATSLMKLFFRATYTDLGPFRAISYDSLLMLGMKDQDYGWTIEMQIKAHKLRLSYKEVPVNYRKRIGVSKVSGTVKGTIMAGYKIILTIFKYL